MINYVFLYIFIFGIVRKGKIAVFSVEIFLSRPNVFLPSLMGNIKNSTFQFHMLLEVSLNKKIPTTINLKIKVRKILQIGNKSWLYYTDVCRFIP